MRRSDGMNRRKLGLTMFWTGLLIALSFAGVIGRSLYHHLRTLTMEELSATPWAEGGPLFILWALSVTLGSIVAGVGAFVYVNTKAVFSWLVGFGVLGAVTAFVMVWSRIYDSTLFGVGGIVTLLCFFALVWVWMKKHEGLDLQARIAGAYRLIGYIFWINASWFLCGETAKMHLKAFASSSVPSPIEIMVFLVLGWLFVLIGEYQEIQLARSSRDHS
jgi:uncharacterized membrane protein